MAIRREGLGSGKIAVSFVLVIIASFVSAACLPFFSPEVPEETAGGPVRAGIFAYTPHLPILIDDDADFELQGWPGKGTVNDPYVIEGLDIDGLGFQVPICIRATTAHFVVRGCYIYNGVDAGILLDGIQNGIVTANLCTDNSPWGIWVKLSEGVSVIGNTCTDNYWAVEDGAGIYLDHSPGGLVSDNVCAANYGDGIRSSYSEDAAISGNNCSGNFASGILLNWGSFNISDNECFDNADADIYLGGILADGSSTVYGNRCSNMEASGMFGCTVSRNTCGRLWMLCCDDNVVANNTFRSHGISLAGSDIFGGCQNNLVADNNCSHSSYYGVWVYLITSDGSEDNISGGNTFLRNNLTHCRWAGLAAECSDGNLFDGNNYSHSETGLLLEECDKNLIRNERSAGNSGHAMHFIDSTYNTLRDCAMWSAGVGISGGLAVQWATHDIDDSNTVNGLPIYYAKGLITGSVPCGFGQVILAASKNVEMEGISIENASIGIAIGHCSDVTVSNSSGNRNGIHGITVEYSTDCTLVDNEFSWNGWSGVNASGSDGLRMTNNTCEHNLEHGILAQACNRGTYQRNNCSFNSKDGLKLLTSTFNNITGNVFEGNLKYGVKIDSVWTVGNNRVWGNVFIYNNLGGKQGYSAGTGNLWNISAMGNWWSDWQEPDSDGDGFVDVPYILDGGSGARDYLPLTGLSVIPEPSPIVLVSILMLVLALVGAANRRRQRTK